MEKENTEKLARRIKGDEKRAALKREVLEEQTRRVENAVVSCQYSLAQPALFIVSLPILCKFLLSKFFCVVIIKGLVVPDCNSTNDMYYLYFS